MNGDKRLDSLRGLLTRAHRALDLSFGFELWDGSSVPRDLPRQMLFPLARARAGDDRGSPR